MAAGINTTITFMSATSDSATFMLTNQYTSETGYVVVFSSTGATEIARSSTVTIYQSSLTVTVNGLSPNTSYYADFYEVNWGTFTGAGESFSTTAQVSQDANTYLAASDIRVPVDVATFSPNDAEISFTEDAETKLTNAMLSHVPINELADGEYLTLTITAEPL